MKFQIFALVFAMFVLIAHGLPIEDEQPAEERAIRQKRVTCDVLSAEAGGIAVNHAACALHCIALKKKGGYCSNGVCHCRN